MMKEVMQQSGWTEPQDKITIPKPTSPGIYKTGNQWKAEVKRMRQSMIDKRLDDSQGADQGPSAPMTINRVVDPAQV